MPSDRTFGARLALIRQHMGWGNIAEAALACGLPANSWRNWERDNRMPMRAAQICAAIAARTGVDRSWLMWGPRDAVVDPPIGHITPEGHDRPAASVRNVPVTVRSARTDYPDRVRPLDNRPSGHPKFPVLPPGPDRTSPMYRRPAPRQRTA